MSMRSLSLIAAAVLLIVGTIVFARSWLESQRVPVGQPKVEAKSNAAEVLVAKQDLPVGVFITQEALRWQAWPDDNLPESYLQKKEHKMEDLLGTVVRHSLSEGQPVTMDRIIKPGERGFLAAVLQAGYRAVSIPIGAASGIAGLVFPGDRVDILLSHSIESGGETEGNEPRAAETVLKNVRVLALDQKIDDKSEEPRLAKTATLEVLPKQAEILAVARELGSLSMSLRSLAKDEEEMERLARGEDPLELPEPEPGQTYTWDSEASLLVPNRAELDAEGAIVTIARGKELEQMRFTGAN